MNRTFIKLAPAILILTGWSNTLPAQTPAPQPSISIQNTASYTFMVGNVKVTALSDGTVPQDLHTLLRGTTDAATDHLLSRGYVTNPLETSLNVFLLRVGERLVLVDVGAGQQFGPGFGGRLVQSLASEHVTPDQITDVLISHAHPDHAGGLVHDGQIVFKNATVHIGKPDLDFFLDRSNAEKAHYDVQYFDKAEAILKPYVEAGKLQPFSGSTEILPGLTGTVHPGHTPGSAFYTLQSQGQELVFLGDIVHAATVQFPHPEITIVYDVDQKRAAQTRQETFAQFARERTLVAAPHLPFPGVGHIRTSGDGYDWVPVEYANRGGK